MDIHEVFSCKEEALKKVVEKIEKNRENMESETSWEVFESFLYELFQSQDERIRERVIELAINPQSEDMQHHDKLKKAHQLFCHYEYELKKVVYKSGFDEISVQYDLDEEEKPDD